VSVDYPVAEWIEVIRTSIECEFGPLPPFRTAYANPPRRYRKLGIPWFIPERFGSDATPTLVSFPKNIEELLGGNDPTFYGSYLIFSLIHDVIHFYQEAPLEQVIPKFYWFLPEWLKDKRDWTKTWDWVEGSPQLGAWKIYNDLLSLSDDELGWLIGRILGTSHGREARHNLARYGGISLANAIEKLSMAGLLPERSTRSLSLPFPLDRGIEEYTLSILEESAKERGESKDVDSRQLSYERGMFFCARIVSSGQMTLTELLRTPLTNRELRTRAALAASNG
jgi:hypothetical protein